MRWHELIAWLDTIPHEDLTDAEVAQMITDDPDNTWTPNAGNIAYARMQIAQRPAPVTEPLEVIVTEDDTDADD